MGWWQVSADTLAGSRFVVSPLVETTACWLVLESGTARHPSERRWLDRHLAGYRRRLAADPITEALAPALWSHRWITDFLIPPPTTDRTLPFDDELDRVRSTPADAARADLAVTLGGAIPPELDRADLPTRAADLLAWVWRVAVSPSWPHRRRVLEADVVAKGGQLSQGGWAAAVDTMGPRVRWLGDGRLQINTYDNPPRDISGADLMFAPVTRDRGWVSWDTPTDPGQPPTARRRYALVYPCSGALAGADRPPTRTSLRRLLGPARAGVLTLLDSPKTTSQLVALTGQGLGSVGRHLKVLHEAGLVCRRRTGRSVLYYRSDTGDALLAAQPPG